MDRSSAKVQKTLTYGTNRKDWTLQNAGERGGFIFKQNARDTWLGGNRRRHTTGRTRFPVDLFISYLVDEKRRSRQDSRLGSIASDDTDAVVLESSANARQIAGFASDGTGPTFYRHRRIRLRAKLCARSKTLAGYVATYVRVS